MAFFTITPRRLGGWEDVLETIGYLGLKKFAEGWYELPNGRHLYGNEKEGWTLEPPVE